jgi:hypothetical protein
MSGGSVFALAWKITGTAQGQVGDEKRITPKRFKRSAILATQIPARRR